MDPVTNPFVPGAGTPPPELVGREQLLEKSRIALSRIQRGNPAKSLIIVGLRGVGKTVLLVSIEDLAKTLGFKTIMIEAPEGKSLAQLLI
ncbi:MAG: ATP-binding protein, partial [Hyphomicrobiales bacterium]|nr:ATP-binding protein [Hyphomicrobiales bacterium]